MTPYQSSDDVVVYVEGPRVLRRNANGAAVELVRLDAGSIATDVALNRTGSLLAVAARKALSIWITEGVSPAQRLRVDGLRFDDYIIDLAWHPCAREDACLVVLTQRALISVYCPPGAKPVTETTRLLDAENIELDAAGMSFGSMDAPAGALTLYVANTDGDIYGICPFVPPEIELSKERLSSMRESTSLGTWPVELDSWSPKRGEVTVLKRPSHEELPLRVSAEPLKLVPYPDELYDEEVLDLAVAGLGSSWASDLVVQTSTHFVNFFISGLPTQKELVLVACVKFSRAQKVRKVRVVTPKVVVVDTQSETHVLNIGEWLMELEHIRRQHALGPTTAPMVPPNLPPTHVESVALSYAYCTPRALEVIPVATSAPSKSWALQSTTEDTLADSLKNLDLDSPSYVRPTGTRWEALTKIDPAPSRLPTSVLDSNLAALYDLDDVSQSYETKTSSLLKALLEVHLHRLTQRKELLLQLERATALSHKLESLETKASGLPKAIQAAAKRQEQLNARIRKVSDTVSRLEEKSISERPLCAAEEYWFEELEAQLSQKAAKAEDQFTALKSSVASLKALGTSQRRSNTAQTLTHAQIRTIKTRLQRQESVIASLTKSLDQSS